MEIVSEIFDFKTYCNFNISFSAYVVRAYFRITSPRDQMGYNNKGVCLIDKTLLPFYKKKSKHSNAREKLKGSRNQEDDKAVGSKVTLSKNSSYTQLTRMYEIWSRWKNNYRIKKKNNMSFILPHNKTLI